MKKLNELKEEERKAVSKLVSARLQITKFENEKLLPAFKDKYEGKYFKYKNCYSCPEKESDYWYMYIKITEVKQTYWMSGYTFQTDKDGKVLIEVERALTESRCEIPIMKREFDSAYRKMLKKIDSIYKR